METVQIKQETQDGSFNKRPRCPNWTEQDKTILVKSIQARKEIIMSKNKSDTALRDAAWQQILEAVNAGTHFPRTLEQVKKQYENLKLRARQIYNDIVQCKGIVKPHILSPAMKIMIDDFKEQTMPQHMMFEALSNSNSGLNQFIKKKPTTPQPILPKPSPTTTTISVPVTTNISFDDSYSISDPNSNGGSNETDHSASTNNMTDHSNDQSDYMTSAKRRKITDTRTMDPLMAEYEVERIQAETERHRAETDLIYQRRECEYAIYDLKRQVLEAKLEYYKNKKDTDRESTSGDKS